MTGAVGWLSHPSVSSSTGPFDRDVPDTTVVFARDPAVIPRHPSFLHGDLSFAYDTRTHPGHPTAGGVYRGAWVGYGDRDHAGYTFARYETEGAHFVPLAHGRVVLAMRGLGVFSTSKTSSIIPFYLLPSLGGNNTLRGYADYRFHDRHLLVANIESRTSLTMHVDGALFFDAGNVAAHVDELNLARTSYGAGVRLHTGASTLARLDIARGHEGWRVLFRISDPLRLARLSRRTAAMPFVP
jgi:outer membrane translocation and assembly module TamA